MALKRPATVSGGLLCWPKPVWEIVAGLLTSGPGIERISAGSDGWSLIVFSTKDPLVDEVGLFGDQKRGGVFQYEFLLFESGNHVIIGSERRAWNWKFIKRVGADEWAYPPRIKVEQLIKSWRDFSSVYSLVGLYSRLEDYGDSLNSISMYGSDIAHTELFDELLDRMIPFRVRMRGAERHEDVFSVDVNGAVDFRFEDSQSLASVVDGVSFLSGSGLVEWPF